jgi:hypothetical protein
MREPLIHFLLLKRIAWPQWAWRVPVYLIGPLALPGR